MGLYALALAALQAPPIAAQPAKFDLAGMVVPLSPHMLTAGVPSRSRFLPPEIEPPVHRRPPIEVKWRLKKIKVRMDIPSI